MNIRKHSILPVYLCMNVIYNGLKIIIHLSNDKSSMLKRIKMRIVFTFKLLSLYILIR